MILPEHSVFAFSIEKHPSKNRPAQSEYAKQAVGRVYSFLIAVHVLGYFDQIHVGVTEIH
jgi:hypothetical protein